MALFEFELAPVERVLPWGKPGDLSLSWFALTDGRFRMVVGDQVLFRYTDEISSHWGQSNLDRDADYQIAALTREMLGSVAAGTTRLPSRIELLARDWELLMQLHKNAEDDEARGVTEDLSYTAWRWLGERSPWAGYFVAHPNFQFVRIGDEVHIHWDNRGRLIDGIPVWTAQNGVHVLSTEVFLNECRDFADRLLNAMDKRIAGIESGSMRPQIEVSTESLRQQHEKWRTEFASYFREHKPDVSWEETEVAIRTIAEKKEIPLP